MNTKLFIFPMIYLISSCTASSYTFTDKKTSYLRFDQWDAATYGKLRFRFKTYSTYGLLFYSDNSLISTSVQNFIVLKLTYGKLSLTVQMGSEDYRSKKTETLGSNLNDLNWHLVEIYRNERETTLKLDSKEEVILINEGEYDKLELNTGVFFGGISMTMSKQIVDMSVLSMPRFIGCMEEIQFSKENGIKLPDIPMIETKFSTTEKMKKKPTRYDPRSSTRYPNELISYTLVGIVKEEVGITKGCMDACGNYICPNNGRCINQFTTSNCDCVGTGFYGRTCEDEAESIHLKGKEFITVNVGGPLKSTSENEITLRFKTNYGDGLLLAAWSGHDHIMVEMHSTVVRLSLNLGGGDHISEIREIPFNDGRWHLLEIKRKGRYTSFTADRKYSVNSTTPGVFSKFDLRDLLYIGGYPDTDALIDINAESKQNFKGCLQQIYYNNVDIIYKTMNTNSARFQKRGTIQKGCSVKLRKDRDERETKGSSISKSGDNSGNNPQNQNTIKATQPAAVEKEQVSSGSSGKLSKKTIIWIAIGLVIGSVIIIIAIALIVHNVRNRYSDVVFNKHLKPSNEFLSQSLSRRPNETVIYTPRNGKILLEPELV